VNSHQVFGGGCFVRSGSAAGCSSSPQVQVRFFNIKIRLYPRPNACLNDTVGQGLRPGGRCISVLFLIAALYFDWLVTKCRNEKKKSAFIRRIRVNLCSISSSVTLYFD
jgi:hypothetical protein